MLVVFYIYINFSFSSVVIITLSWSSLPLVDSPNYPLIFLKIRNLTFLNKSIHASRKIPIIMKIN